MRTLTAQEFKNHFFSNGDFRSFGKYVVIEKINFHYCTIDHDIHLGQGNFANFCCGELNFKTLYCNDAAFHTFDCDVSTAEYFFCDNATFQIFDCGKSFEEFSRELRIRSFQCNTAAFKKVLAENNYRLGKIISRHSTH